MKISRNSLAKFVEICYNECKSLRHGGNTVSKNVWEIMFASCADNWYILVACAIEIVLFILTISESKIVEGKLKSGNKASINNANYYRLDIYYTLFITFISIFPLLGMFGTVQALLTLDTSGDMVGLKDNFFLALTSTAWGIVFAIVFKIANAFIQASTESHISIMKNILGK